MIKIKAKIQHEKKKSKGQEKYALSKKLQCLKTRQICSTLLQSKVIKNKTYEMPFLILQTGKNWGPNKIKCWSTHRETHRWVLRSVSTEDQAEQYLERRSGKLSPAIQVSVLNQITHDLVQALPYYLPKDRT